MKLTPTVEWSILGALIVYIALTPGFPVVRQFLTTGLGKVLALGGIVYVWKFVSQPVAILLTIAVLQCMRMREGMKNPRAHCPMGYTLSDENMCIDETGKEGPPPTICLEGQKWDITTGKCQGASASTSAGIEPSTLSTPTEESAMPELPSAESSDVPREGFQPNQKDTNKYAPV
jgi:hypothetical protein